MLTIKLAKGHKIITIPVLFLLLTSVIWFIRNITNKHNNLFDTFFLFGSTILFLLVIVFFRDPERIPDSYRETDIVSPADGIVFEIDKTSEKNFIIVRIRMRFWDVHVNYMPITGKLIQRKKIKGFFLPILPGLNKYSKQKNARQVFEFSSEKGFSFKLIQISGIFAYRTVSYLKIGDFVQKGEKIGMIRFGSETDVYLPTSELDRILVRSGEKVQAGKTIIGSLNSI